uniref:Uncharacterized protein n=1 Tax=Zea mays TaxID=4577 RepID=C4J4Q3_MAIZE|nr:unknown [Zea mays]
MSRARQFGNAFFFQITTIKPARSGRLPIRFPFFLGSILFLLFFR